MLLYFKLLLERFTGLLRQQFQQLPKQQYHTLKKYWMWNTVRWAVRNLFLFHIFKLTAKISDTKKSAAIVIVYKLRLFVAAVNCVQIRCVW